MHEIAHAQAVINQAKKLGAKKGAIVEVGELCDLEAHELEETMKRLINWNLEVKEKESKIECVCGYKGKARILDKGHGYCYFDCPNCSALGKSIKVLEGNEIKILGVE